MRPSIVMIALALLPLSACASRGQTPAEGAAAPYEELAVVRGQVEGMMPDPMEALIFRVEGRTMQLTGELVQELARLTGAEVEVAGVLRSESPRPLLEARGYRVVSVNDRPALAGILVEENGRLLLELSTGERVTLIGAESLAPGRVGAKVWVTGDRDGARIVIESLGVIRDP